jgi:hypothetical protein
MCRFAIAIALAGLALAPTVNAAESKMAASPADVKLRRSIQGRRLYRPFETARRLQIPAHWHPTDEGVTILSGKFHAGIGDALDQAANGTTQPSGFVLVPANMHHYAWVDGAEMVIQSARRWAV